MPEGDVVTRVAHTLTAAIADHTLTHCELRWPTLGGTDLTGEVAGKTSSYGKHLFTQIGDELLLHSHLRMDGMWRMNPPIPKYRLPTDHRLRAILSTEQVTALGWQLGMLNLIKAGSIGTIIGPLGPDLMSPTPDFEEAVHRLQHHASREIGACLLDQSIAAGIGTIYMAETLWLYRINPFRPAQEVAEPAKLFLTASELMKRSVRSKHLTATGDTRAGYETAVHGRVGKPCRRCGDYIKRKLIGQAPYERPAFYCPTCQPT